MHGVNWKRKAAQGFQQARITRSFQRIDAKHLNKIKRLNKRERSGNQSGTHRPKAQGKWFGRSGRLKNPAGIPYHCREKVTVAKGI
jgi:hypothetical protein